MRQMESISKKQLRRVAIHRSQRQMLAVLASMTVGQHDSFSQPKSPAIIIVLAGPIDNRTQRRILVNCEITKISPDDLEITCAD